MAKAIKVLHIEDSLVAKGIVQACLEKSGDVPFELVQADRLAEAQKILGNQTFDVVLLDLRLPDSSGKELYDAIHQQVPRTPIVILSGNFEERAAAIQRLKGGAQDFLLKDNLQEEILVRSLLYAIERKQLEVFKDDFISTVSHELRTPLAILKGAIGNLKEGVVGSLSKKQREVTETADRNIKRLEKVVDDLLDLARLESGQRMPKLQVLQILSLMTGLVSELQETALKNHRVLKTDLPTTLPSVSADPDLLTEVFLNLFNNALCFAKNTIEVKAAISGDKGKGKWVQISVIDDGPGIPEERLQDIFKKFYQLDLPGARKGYKGTGLGLAICKEIIEQHHGKIWAESNLGQGAAFHFTVPIKRG